MVFTPDFWEKKCDELNQENEQATKRYCFWLAKSLGWMLVLVIGTGLSAFPVQRFLTDGINLATVDFFTKFIQQSLADIGFLFSAYKEWVMRIIQLADNKYWFIPFIPFICLGYTLYVGIKLNPYRKQLQLRKTRYHVHSENTGNI